MLRTVKQSKLLGGWGGEWSEEVLRARFLGAEDAPHVAGPRLEDGELLLEVLVEFQDGGNVAAAVAVVGR